MLNLRFVIGPIRPKVNYNKGRHIVVKASKEVNLIGIVLFSEVRYFVLNFFKCYSHFPAPSLLIQESVQVIELLQEQVSCLQSRLNDMDMMAGIVKHRIELLIGKFPNFSCPYTSYIQYITVKLSFFFTNLFTAESCK